MESVGITNSNGLNRSIWISHRLYLLDCLQKWNLPCHQIIFYSGTDLSKNCEHLRDSVWGGNEAPRIYTWTERITPALTRSLSLSLSHRHTHREICVTDASVRVSNTRLMWCAIRENTQRLISEILIKREEVFFFNKQRSTPLQEQSSEVDFK